MNYYGDLHCDTLWRCFEARTDLNAPSLQLGRNPPFHHLQTYAIYIPDAIEDKYHYFRAVYAYGQELFRRYPEMVLCRDAKEIDAAFKAGKTPYLLSIEGGGFFEEDRGRNKCIARELKEKGIAFLSLCYNRGNHLAGGTLCPERGLSALGADVAELLREEGISLDLSHMNHRSADALLALLPDGVVATHSNCYTLAPHGRNLTDDQIRDIKEKKGLIGINFYPPFLSGKQQADMEDILLHIRYLERLGGAPVIAFGSDFDGIEATPDGLSSLGDLPALGSALERACTAPAAAQYLYENMKRYLDDFLKK